MNSSPELKELFEAMAKAQAEWRPATKSREFDKNVNGGASYSTIQDLSEAIYQTWGKYGLSITQHVVIYENEYAIKTKVTHLSGSYMEEYCPLLPGKDIRGRITETRKYTLMALTGICGSEDEDLAADDYKGDARTKPRSNENRSSNDNVVAKITAPQLNELIEEIQKLDDGIRTEVVTQIALYNKVKVLSDLRQDQFAGALRSVKAKQK